MAPSTYQNKISLLTNQGFSEERLNLRKFLLDEDGQDLIEYSLLLAFIMLASGAIFIDVSDNTMWNMASDTLSNAVTAAS